MPARGTLGAVVQEYVKLPRTDRIRQTISVQISDGLSRKSHSSLARAVESA